MQYQWVIGTYTGERAKSVVAHAGAGIGYFIQNQGGAGQSYTVNAAFRRAIDSFLPDNTIVANQIQIEKLDTMYASRHGSPGRKPFGREVSSVSEIGARHVH